MTSISPPGPRGTSVVRNRLLRGIPHDEYARLLPHLESVAIEPMQIIAQPGERIPYVHFPETGVISLLTRQRDGMLIENGTVGSEGMTGLPVALGVSWTPALIAGEVPGISRRIDAARFVELLAELPGLRVLLGAYAVYLLGQVSWSLACNGTHPIHKRCARWLLMTHDRVERDEFLLTHEVLAQMLAVRRAGVTEAASGLQEAGLIRYTRGHVTVTDRVGLEDAACECYAAVRDLTERLLPADA